MATNILADIRNSASSGDSGGSWGTVPGLSATGLTVQGTNSVLLILASIAQLPETDSSAEYRLNIDGTTSISPVLTTFADNATGSETGNTTLAFAVDGLSGSGIDISVEWQTLQGTPSKDTSRVSTLLILEITGGDAVLQADLFSVATASAPGSWGELFGTGSISINGTGSVILLLSNVPTLDGATDTVFETQFSVDDSQEGAVNGCAVDEANGATGWSGIHVLDGLSAGSHTFELMWQIRYGSPSADTARRRTFQVVEIKTEAVLESSIITAASHTGTGSWADDGTLDAAVTVAGPASTMLQIANMNFVAGTDRTAGFRLAMDAAQEGADLVDFSDSTDRAGRTLLAAAKTGMSAASHDFSVQWLAVQSTVIADTARNRSQFVIQFSGVSYQIDGVTRDKNESLLGTCEVYVFKDNGDNTLSYVGYDQSDGSGNYSITGIGDEDASYLVYAYKADTPHVMDVSDHDIQPDDGTASTVLYLRSDSDKGETSPDNDLRLRSDADKVTGIIEFSMSPSATSNITAADLNIKREIASAIVAESDITGGAVQSPEFESHNLVTAVTDQVTHDLTVTNPAGLTNRMLLVACWQENIGGAGPAITDIEIDSSPVTETLIDEAAVLSTDWLSLEVYRIMEADLPAAGSGTFDVNVTLASSNVLCITASIIEKVNQTTPIDNNNSQSDTSSTFITTNINVDSVTDRLFSFCVGSLNNQSWNATSRTEHADFLTGQSTGLVSSEVTGIQTPEAVTETASSSHARLCHVVFTVQGSGSGADTELLVFRELSTAIAADSDITNADLNILRELLNAIVAESNTSDIEVEVGGLITFSLNIIAESDLADIDLIRILEYASSIVAESNTSGTDLSILREVASAPVADSNTSGIDIDLTINMIAAIQADSDLAAIDLIRKIELGNQFITDEYFSSGGEVLPGWSDWVTGSGLVDPAYDTSFFGSPAGWGQHCLRAFTPNSDERAVIGSFTLGTGDEHPSSYIEFYFYAVSNPQDHEAGEYTIIAYIQGAEVGYFCGDIRIEYVSGVSKFSIHPNTDSPIPTYFSDIIPIHSETYRFGFEYNAGLRTWRWWINEEEQPNGNGVIESAVTSPKCINGAYIGIWNSDTDSREYYYDNIRTYVNKPYRAGSVLAGIDPTAVRELSTAIVTESDIADIDAVALRELSLASTAVSNTTDIDLDILLKLISQITADSNITNIDLSSLRELAAVIAVESVTSGIDITRKIEFNAARRAIETFSAEGFDLTGWSKITTGGTVDENKLITEVKGAPQDWSELCLEAVSTSGGNAVALNNNFPGTEVTSKESFIRFAVIFNDDIKNFVSTEEINFARIVSSTNDIAQFYLNHDGSGMKFNATVYAGDSGGSIPATASLYAKKDKVYEIEFLWLRDAEKWAAAVNGVLFVGSPNNNIASNAPAQGITGGRWGVLLADRGITSYTDNIDVRKGRNIIAVDNVSEIILGDKREIATSAVAESVTSGIDLTRLMELSSAYSADSVTAAIELAVKRELTNQIVAESDLTGINLNIAGLIEFVTNIIADSVTSSIALNIKRELSAAFTAGSVTSGIDLDISVLIELVSSIVAESASTCNLKVLRELNSIIPAASSTSSATLNVLRELATSLTAASASSDIDLTLLAELASAIIAESNTSGLTLKVTRELLNVISATSTVNDVDVNVLRELTSSIIGASLTSDIDLLIAGFVEFALNIQADSNISDAELSIKRELLTNIISVSATSGIDLDIGVLLEFVTAIVAETATANIDLNVLRELNSQIVTASLTSDIELLVTGFIEFATNIVAQSVTTDVILNIFRELTTSVAVASDISGISLNVLRELALNILAGSNITNVDLQNLLGLVSSITASSNISDADLKVLREFISAVQATSDTTGVNLNVLRELAATFSAASLVSSIDLIIGLFLEFVSSMAASSDIADVNLDAGRSLILQAVASSDVTTVSLSIARALAASINVASNLSDAQLNVLREIASNIQADSDVINIDLILGQLRELAGQWTAESVLSDAELLISLIGEIINTQWVSLSTDRKIISFSAHRKIEFKSIKRKVEFIRRQQ